MMLTIFVNMKIQYYKADIGYKLRYTLFEHLLKLPPSYFEKNSTGYIMSRQTDDPEGIEGMMLYNITDSILAFLEFAAILTIMFKSSISLTLIALAIIIGDFSITFAFPLKRLYKDHNKAKAHINKELQDSISGIKLIKANYSINYELDRFKIVLHNYFNKRLKRDRIDIIRRSVGSFLRGLSTPLIIIIGGYFIFKGNLSVGCVMSFTLYFQRLTTVFTPIVNFVPLYKIAKASSERMDEVLSVQVEDDTIHDTEKNTIKGY